MTDLRDLADQLTLDAQAIRQALEAAHAGQEDAQPWYVRTLLSIGAWVTSLPLLALGAMVVVEIVPDWEGSAPFVIAGLILFAFGVSLVRRTGGVFRTQLGASFGVAGAALAGGGMLVDMDALAVATLVTAVLAGVGIALTRDASFQALLAACAAAFGVVTLLDMLGPVTQLWLALALPAGCWLLLHPPRKDLRALAVVLLFTALLGLAWTDQGFVPLATEGTEGTEGMGAPEWQALAGAADPWLARAVAIATMAWLLLPASGAGRAALLLPGGAALLCLILPASGGAGLVILALAYTLGSGLLALGGGLGLSYALFVFYYDLDTTLLIKSAMLVAAGAIVLVVWRIVTPRGGQAP